MDGGHEFGKALLHYFENLSFLGRLGTIQMLEINDLHIFWPSGHETEANEEAPPIKIAYESAAGTTLDINEGHPLRMG
jgi:hypothetical protein